MPQGTLSLMYYDPPYFLLIVGLFAGITCGRAFEVTLRQAVKTWSETRSTRILQQLQGFSLVVPFLGICAGICIFLASGLYIFGLPLQFSYITSLVLTVMTGVLIWSQLRNLLLLLQSGGSKAIDLDALE
jgi:hypothetical protein